MNSIVKRFFDTFVQSKYWIDMTNTVENSNWHREANTAVHTEMMLDWYYKNCSSQRTAKQQILTTLAIIFHDVGKPAVEEVKESEARGQWRSYARHEQASMRIFEHVMMSDNAKNQTQLQLSNHDMYTIMYMIENHLPFKNKIGSSIGAKNPIHGLKTTLNFFIGEDLTPFYDLLRSDQHGRISDNAAEEQAEVEDWIAEFDSIEAIQTNNSEKNMIVLIGASGSGKSTYVRKVLLANNAKVVSLDPDRIEFAEKHEIDVIGKTGYANAFEYCANNQQAFTNFHDMKVRQAIASGETLIVDNTNLSKKARNKYISFAKQNGYAVVAKMFPTDLHTIVERQDTRADKRVPIDAVTRQYNTISLPLLGHEVDKIII